MRRSMPAMRHAFTAFGAALLLFLAVPVLAQEAGETGADAEEPVAAAAPVPPGPVGAAVQPPKPKSLKELLDLVRKGFDQEREENRRREQAFRAAKADQERLLAEAEADLEREEAVSQRLEDAYNQNEGTIATQQERLTDRLGELGELFGVVRLVANDLAGNTWESLTSSQLRGRKELLDRMGRSTELPSTEDLENLWYELQRELIAQGEVVRFSTPVLTLAGSEEPMEVIRVGPFSAIGRGK